MFAFGWSTCERKPECPEETYLSDLVTTWPSHMPTPGIEPWSQGWEASALTLRQSDSHVSHAHFSVWQRNWWLEVLLIAISSNWTFYLLSGGIFGTVNVYVRTVGGGEDWTSQIVPKPGATTNDTITEILGNRDRFTSAVGGTDYVVLDTVVQFKVHMYSKIERRNLL